MRRLPTQAARARPGRGATAAALLGAAALAACHHEVYVIGPVGQPSPAEPAAARVLVFGDFGERTVPQWLVARALRSAVEARPFDFALQLGDNIYRCGPDPTVAGAAACRLGVDGAAAPGTAAPPDPLFGKNEAPLAGLRGRDGAALPIYLALGNHDVASGGSCAVQGLPPREVERRRACLEVAHRSASWRMPARHYVVDRGPLRIVVIDTNVVVADYGGFTLDDEIAFVRLATAACGLARTCFLAGHHPPASIHEDPVRPSPLPTPYQLRMQRLLAAARGQVRGFFAGHVHTLEHLSLGDLEVFISGSTAMGGFQRLRAQAPARARPSFATTDWGYAVLEVGAHGYRVRFVNFLGVPLHCCEAGRTGPCRPVACG